MQLMVKPGRPFMLRDVQKKSMDVLSDAETNDLNTNFKGLRQFCVAIPDAVNLSHLKPAAPTTAPSAPVAAATPEEK